MYEKNHERPAEQEIRDFGPTRGDTYGIGKAQPVGREGSARDSGAITKGCKIIEVINP